MGKNRNLDFLKIFMTQCLFEKEIRVIAISTLCKFYDVREIPNVYLGINKRVHFSSSRHASARDVLGNILDSQNQ